ncbi:MAG: (d)CMP kinase [Flavobacteriia bacterium]|nr:(d)CMP kinase [Flavobacteriia bacterium]
MLGKKITIAIDGFSSCGKSTLAKALAKQLDYIFIDTGAMYRGIALFCIQNSLVENNEILKEKLLNCLNQIELHFELSKETSYPELYLNKLNVDSQIRSLEVSSLVSKVASIMEVRKKMVKAQRKMGEKGGIVMDGRDIGSVVFPNAELKLFITAAPEIRTQRRYLELKKVNPTVSIEEIDRNLKERDFLDSTRKESPLIQCDDAIVIDNSNLNPKEQLDFVLKLVNEKIK